MRKSATITFLFLIFGLSSLCAQVEVTEKLFIADTIVSTPIDPLRPAKAAFYSAILPGLGQAYNKKYWKIPLVYGGLGTTLYVYSFNNNKYHEYRDAYKKRLAGEPETEYAFLDDDRLIRAQKYHQRNRDLSLLVAGAFYVLNIVDANIDAHLKQFNVDENLTLAPDFKLNDFDSKPTLVLTLNYRF